MNDHHNHEHNFYDIRLLSFMNTVDCSPPRLTEGLGIQMSFDRKVISFYCSPGYDLFGPYYSRCQDNGLWSNQVPVCIGEF